MGLGDVRLSLRSKCSEQKGTCRGAPGAGTLGYFLAVMLAQPTRVVGETNHLQSHFRDRMSQEVTEERKVLEI